MAASGGLPNCSAIPWIWAIALGLGRTADHSNSREWGVDFLVPSVKAWRGEGFIYNPSHLFYFCSPDDERASDSILHLFDAGVHVVLRDIWGKWKQWGGLLLPAGALQWVPWWLRRIQGSWQRWRGKSWFGDRVWNSSSWWLLSCCCCCCPCCATDLQGRKRGTWALRTLRVFSVGPLKTLEDLCERKSLSTGVDWSKRVSI